MIIVQDGEGKSSPRNIKLTKFFCILKIANEVSETFSKPALETIQIVSLSSGHGYGKEFLVRFTANPRSYNLLRNG